MHQVLALRYGQLRLWAPGALGSLRLQSAAVGSHRPFRQQGMVCRMSWILTDERASSLATFQASVMAWEYSLAP